MQTTIQTPFGAVSARAEGFGTKLSFEKRADCSAVVLELSADAPRTPRDVTVEWTCFVPDVHCAWTPDSGDFRGLRPDWGEEQVHSRSASGAPVLALVSQTGENCLTVSLSEAGEACRIGCGVREEKTDFRFRVTFFTQLTTPLRTYRAEIRLDERKIPFGDALRAACARWDALYPPCAIPEAAEEPVYSCWYSMHQQVTTEEVLRQCRLAADYGMKTVIVDDGWQTDDNNRGYAFCGDWELATKKIPDMAELVRQVHALGMRFVLWYAVPLVGKNSRSFAAFEGKYLDTLGDLGCCTLDPRYPECRAFLRDIYLTAAKAWDLDGLKLDFIDSFRLTEASNTDTAGMDCVNLEQAVQKLLDEVTQALRAFKPDFLIEFRQSYIGPVMRQFGNMLRVGDCPVCALRNRTGSITLRLLSGETAVHSDMLEWNAADTPEAAAQQLWSILFCVPQISVQLDRLPAAHRDLLRTYLTFWQENRDLLLHGTLDAEAPQANYTRVTAVKDGAGVTALYARADAVLRGCDMWTVVNACGSDVLYIESDRDFSCEVCTCCGETVDRFSIRQGLHRLAVPLSGFVRMRSADAENG